MKTNLIVCQEDKKLYFIVRLFDGQVRNAKKHTNEPYKDKDRKNYVRYPINTGGGLYVFEDTGDRVIVIYEQQGKKPSKDDLVIDVIGDIKLVNP